MSSPLGFSPRSSLTSPSQNVEHVLIQKALDRILAFTGLSINDVVNDPIAKNKVRSFYKLHRWVHREMEISDLERQWNALRR